LFCGWQGDGGEDGVDEDGFEEALIEYLQTKAPNPYSSDADRDKKDAWDYAMTNHRKRTVPSYYSDREKEAWDHARSIKTKKRHQFRKLWRSNSISRKKRKLEGVDDDFPRDGSVPVDVTVPGFGPGTVPPVLSAPPAVNWAAQFIPGTMPTLPPVTGSTPPAGPSMELALAAEKATLEQTKLKLETCKLKTDIAMKKLDGLMSIANCHHLSKSLKVKAEQYISKIMDLELS